MKSQISPKISPGSRSLKLLRTRSTVSSTAFSRGCPFLHGSTGEDNNLSAFKTSNDSTQDIRMDATCIAQSLPPDDKLPPGSMGLPLVGETLEFMRDRKGFLDRRRQRHGPIWKTHLLGKPTIFVSDVQAVRKILAAEHRLVRNSPPETFKQLLGPSYQGVVL